VGWSGERDSVHCCGHIWESEWRCELEKGLRDGGWEE
jgi:hypothetical protein